MTDETLKRLEERLRQSGLEVVNTGDPLSALGPQWFRNSPLMDDFTPEQADILGAAIVRVRARPGQVLVAEGEIGDWMLVLLSGTVDVTRRMYQRSGASGPATAADNAPKDDITRLAVIKAGAVVGEMSMLDSEPRYATCTAIDAVEAGVLTRQAIARLIQDHPAVGAKLLVKITQLLAQRLRNTSNQLVRALHKK